jgi:PHD/YefM family antitoxin component YafN of YafNO toxin-antitoxin module
MKTVELRECSLSVRELIELARGENVLVKSPDGEEFVFAHVDDFEQEVETLRQSGAFLAFLDKRSREKTRIPLSEARARLLGKGG